MEEMNAPRESRAGPGELECLWIDNEGLLRDEGVVFGLAGNANALEEKQVAIRAYYRLWAADGARRRQAIEDELAPLTEQLAEQEKTTSRASAASQAAWADADEHGAGGLVARHALGLAAAAATCVGTAFFVYEQLRPAFQNPAIVTAGVVGAGFFTAFLPVSLLFVGDGVRRDGAVELWKVRLAEFGLPLVAAAFVVAWAMERLAPAQAIATGALLFLAFAFTGRQLLSSVPRLGSAIRALRQERAADRRLRPGNARDSGGRADTVAALRRELAALRSPEEWEAICQAKLAIFRSEYELAAARGAHAAHPLPHAPIFATNGSR
jgi:hypothetical protein